MTLYSNSEVEEMKKVQDKDGNSVPPANANQLGNFSGLEQFVYSTSTTSAEALDSKTVPEGVTVLVEYNEGNAGTVYVGDSTTQASPLAAVGDGRAFRVNDTSTIYVQTPTSGDGVVVSFEVSA